MCNETGPSARAAAFVASGEGEHLDGHPGLLTARSPGCSARREAAAHGLYRVLSEHPQVVGIREPQIGYNLTPFLADVQGFDAASLDLSTFANRRRRRGQRSEFFNDEFADQWGPDLGRLLRGRFHAQVRRYNPEQSLRQVEVLAQEPNGSQASRISS